MHRRAVWVVFVCTFLPGCDRSEPGAGPAAQQAPAPAERASETQPAPAATPTSPAATDAGEAEGPDHTDVHEFAAYNATHTYWLAPTIELIQSGEIPREHQRIIYAILARTNEVLIHRMRGQEGNVVYLGPGGHREAVYDADGELVEDGFNDGTYNYAHPVREPLVHFTSDISPWIAWGLSKADPTSVEDRVYAYMGDLEGGIRRAHGAVPLPPLADDHAWDEPGQLQALAIFFRAIEAGDAQELFGLFEPERELTDADLIRVLTALNAGFDEVY